MPMNKKIIWGVIIIIIIVLAIYAGRTTPEYKASLLAPQTIKIGIVAPLTGGGASYGTNLVNGVRAALEDAKNTRNTYELLVEDDGTNPAQSASAAQKLINVEKVSALITTTSGSGNAVKPIAATAQIPHICVCSDTRIADGQYNFNNSVLPNEEALAWLREAALRGAKTVAIFSQNQPGFNLLTDNIKSQATSTGLTVVYDERFDPTIKDFNTNIIKAGAVKPDIYLVGFFPPQIDIIGQQLKNNRVTNVAGMATFGIAANPGIYEGDWLSDASLVDPSFKDRLSAKYPEIRFNVRSAPQGYDTATMVIQGFESGTGAAHYLLDLTSHSGKSGMLSKQKGEAVFHSPIGIWEIKDGKPVQVK